MSKESDFYEPSLSKGYPPPPLPEDFPVRLGRLEDRTGVSLEDFARRFELDAARAGEWRCGVLPNAREMRAIMQWACSAEGGAAVMLRDSSEPWPYRG